MRNEWDEVVKASQGTIFRSHAFTMAWLNRFRDRASIEVNLVQRDGKTVGILPAAYHDVKILKVNGKVLSPVGLCGAQNEFHNLGPMTAPGDDESLDSLVKEMSKQRWDLLDFRYLIDSQTNRKFINIVDGKWGIEMRPPDPCPFIELPKEGDPISAIGTWTRRSVRSGIKNLEREERLTFRTLRDHASMMAACKEHVALHQLRWKRKGGSIFDDDAQIEFLHDLVKLAAEGEYGAFYSVEIDGIVAAQLLCFFDDQWCRAYQLSVNDDFLDENPGHLVFYHMMKDVQSRGMHMIDLGPGSDLYKFRLGAKESYIIGFQAMRGKLSLMRKAATFPGIKSIVEMTGMRNKAAESMNAPPKEMK